MMLNMKVWGKFPKMPYVYKCFSLYPSLSPHRMSQHGSSTISSIFLLKLFRSNGLKLESNGTWMIFYDFGVSWILPTLPSHILKISTGGLLVAANILHIGTRWFYAVGRYQLLYISSWHLDLGKFDGIWWDVCDFLTRFGEICLGSFCYMISLGPFFGGTFCEVQWARMDKRDLEFALTSLRIDVMDGALSISHVANKIIFFIVLYTIYKISTYIHVNIYSEKKGQSAVVTGR